jgi:RHS repeat-associated protein
VRYLFGPTVVNGAVTTGILARTSSGGTTAWYLTDQLGSVRDIVSTSGTELDHIVYDSFGTILSQSDSANGDRFLFAGMQFDATMGQYFDNARWYVPGTGRFSTQDPKSFGAGDPNLYRYVFNTPTIWTDPSGMNIALPINPYTGGATVVVLLVMLVYWNTQEGAAQQLGLQLDYQRGHNSMRNNFNLMAAMFSPQNTLANAAIGYTWEELEEMMYNTVQRAQRARMMMDTYSTPPNQDPNKYQAWKELYEMAHKTMDMSIDLMKNHPNRPPPGTNPPTPAPG